MEHTRTKARHPQTNGISESFHKTILQESYSITFQRRLYHSLLELQTDLDAWLEYYNTELTHQGKMCVAGSPCKPSLTGKSTGRKGWTAELLGQGKPSNRR